MLIPRGAAILSEDGLYRTWLERDLGNPDGKVLVSIGANPSTADHERDDQTMRKEQAFARRWGCTFFVKVNVYAYRATKPKDMWAADRRGVDVVGCDVRGLHNDAFIQRALRLAWDRQGIVLAAWGAIPKQPRVAAMLRAISILTEKTPLMCLGANDDGSPKHTLYLPYETPLVRWEPGAWAA